jgi:hypothetical protein
MDKDEVARIRAQAIAEYEAKKKRELSERMAKLGRTRSTKKRKAALKNIKIAQAVLHGKPMPKETKT